MNRKAADKGLALLDEWARSRAEERALLRRARRMPCEIHHADTLKPRCFQERANVTDWCQTCRDRDPIFKAYVSLKRANRALRARLEAQGRRLQLPDLPAEPEEPKLLLEMMNDDDLRGPHREARESAHEGPGRGETEPGPQPSDERTDR